MRAEAGSEQPGDRGGPRAVSEGSVAAVGDGLGSGLSGAPGSCRELPDRPGRRNPGNRGVHAVSQRLEGTFWTGVFFFLPFLPFSRSAYPRLCGAYYVPRVCTAPEAVIAYHPV